MSWDNPSAQPTFPSSLGHCTHLLLMGNWSSAEQNGFIELLLFINLLWGWGQTQMLPHPNSKIQSDVRLKMPVLKLYAAVQIEAI